MTGEFKIFKEINNELEFDATIYKLQGNEYRLTPYKYKCSKACDIIKMEYIIYNKIPKNSDMPEGCPIPVGTYKMDWYPDLSNVPPFLNGEFKINVSVFYKTEYNGALVFFISVERYTVIYR